MKKVLVIGSGGREHAIAMAFAKSPLVKKVYVAPGNPGMLLMDNHKISCIEIQVEEIEALRKFAKDENIDVTFVGPEIPLNLGIVDAFRVEHLPIVGPTKAASQIEASKGFAKDLMTRAGVPTAKYQRFTNQEKAAAKAFLKQFKPPFVIKEDGLAAGKGVVIAQSLAEAEQAIDSLLAVNGSEIVIEEFLTGEEFSFFVMVNEEHMLPLGHARDYKRVGDGDQGLNTGGMGAFSPVPFVDSSVLKEVAQNILIPLTHQMVIEKVPYTGVLYAGLMLTEEGPKVIEFNARFGDPETQILLPRIKNDFYQLCHAHLNKESFEVTLSDEISLGVVLAANGYPQKPVQGMTVSVPSDVIKDVCFAAVKSGRETIEASGGRILMVTSQGYSFEKVREDVYQKIQQIKCEQTFYRKDIGEKFI